jgi:hypothetical protein
MNDDCASTTEEERKRQAVKEKNRIKSAKWREKNRQKMLERDRLARENNRAEYNKKKKEWWRKNKQKARESCRKWNAANKASVNARRNQMLANKPSFRIRKTLTDRLRCALTRKGKTKQSSILRYLGCAPEHLKIHIERQFSKGMHWGNYGINGWHIDHIIPCAEFDLTNDEQCKKCFHFSNLRPLWAWQNHQKSRKIVTCQPELPMELA